MSAKNLVQALESALADTYALYLKTQNYHWNIMGTDFHQLHIMLEGQYRELIEPVDSLAERIRALGKHAPGSFSAFAKLTHIEEAMQAADAAEMIKDLYADQEKIIKTMHHALEEADKVKDVVTVDLLTQRIAAHEKNHWMLGATLNKAHAKVSHAA
ncbi:DNA starvation/stationary phase protection protein [Rickettsiales bacterium]|nr:DNA starvation/stationary phase protection protein [Rickettsiales bacterium]